MTKNKSKKHSRSGKSGIGSSSATPESAFESGGVPAAGSDQVARRKRVIIIWDLNTCGIPEEMGLDQVRENIERAIGADIAEIYIFCANPIVRETYENITQFAPDISDILSIAQALTCHVLMITGDVKYCPTVSKLRRKNLYVGVACSKSDCKMLKQVACYACDWNKIRRGYKSNYFIEPRNLMVEPDINCCMMYPVYVYWDLQTCPIQEEFRENENLLLSLTEAFQEVLRAHNYWGHFKICTYGLLRGMKAIHYQALRNNSMKFQSVAQGTKVDASKMIINDIFLRLKRCDTKSCFMIISNGDVESAAVSVSEQGHELIIARSSSSPPVDVNVDLTLEWPIFWQEE